MIVGVWENPRTGPFLSSHCPVLFPFPLLNGKHHNIVSNESPKLKLDFNLRQTDINLEEVTLKTPLYSFHTANSFLFEGALVSINNKEMLYCQNWSQAKVDKKLQSVQFTETQSSILHLFFKYWPKILNIKEI